jgi:hypothetical protein
MRWNELSKLSSNPPTVTFFSKRKTVEANIKMAEDKLGHDLLD